MKKETAYTLGRIFGELLKLSPSLNTSAVQQNASVSPMKTITELYIKLQRAGTIKANEGKIAYLFDSLDAEDAYTPMTEENKGTFVIGQHKLED